MIVVVAERLSVEDVECLVGERFLHQGLHGERTLQEVRTEKPHVASVTVKAVSMVFPLELPVRGRYSLLLNGEAAATALWSDRELR